jgi:hypothetical protein
VTVRYRTLAPSRDSVSGARVVARLLAGMGFRLYWATEGLSTELYGFRPCEGARSIGETLDHVWELLSWTHTAVCHAAVRKPADVAFLRDSSLELISSMQDRFSELEDTELPAIELLGQPFWPVVNGPLSDVLAHIGQIAMLRRVAGSPAPDSNPFEGTAG